MTDNPGNHQGLQVLRIIPTAANPLFPYPGGPDPNPIHMVTTKRETAVRKADERTAESCWRRGGTFLNVPIFAEFTNCLRHLGHA